MTGDATPQDPHPGDASSVRPLHARASDVFQAVCDLPSADRAAALDAACGEDAALRRAVERLLAFDAPIGASALDGDASAVLDDAVFRDEDGAASAVHGVSAADAASAANAASAADATSAANADEALPPTISIEFSETATMAGAAPRGTGRAATPPPTDIARTPADPALPWAGELDLDELQRVGAYGILEEIGRGGMGRVYRAQQVRPRREVALKVIAASAMRRTTERRFELEAELLGRLQHPGIAAIYEAGSGPAVLGSGSPSDRTLPFIAMELVHGRPLLDALAGVDLRRRIEVLLQICDAIEHAHQRGVVHLDLKPANVLVDDTGAPRILDFGVARALDADLARTLRAEVGDSIAGTLAYMSPEQVRGDAADVDTRADIHALGAIAFELLTGRTPYDVSGARLMDAIQIVLTAAPRRVRDLAPHVDEELAAVVETAIAPVLEDRYASAGALAADLRRWLRAEPVSARPRHPWRSVRLLARRRRSLVVASGVAVTASLVGVSALVVGLLQANAAENRATMEAAAAVEAERVAREEAEKARAVSDFMGRIIFGLDPEVAGRELSFFDAIDYAGARVAQDLIEYPDVEAAVRTSIGTVYRRHALYDKAEGHLRQALRIRRDVLGESHPDTARSMVALSNLISERSGQLDESLLLLESADAILLTYPEEAEASLAWIGLDLGIIHLARDDPYAARVAFERCRGALAERLGDGHPDVSRPVRGLAACALEFGALAEAEQLARGAVARCADRPAEAYIGARARLVLGDVLRVAGRLDDAAAELDAASATFDRLLAPGHGRRAEAHAAQSRLALARGDYAVALDHATRGLEILRPLLDPSHWAVLVAEGAMLHARWRGDAESLQGSAREAALLETDARIAELIEAADRTIGIDHRKTIALVRQHAALAEARGDGVAAAERTATADARDARRRTRLDAAAAAATASAGSAASTASAANTVSAASTTSAASTVSAASTASAAASTAAKDTASAASTASAANTVSAAASTVAKDTASAANTA